MNVSALLSARANAHVICASTDFDEEVLILGSLVEKMPKLAPLLQEFLARSEARLQPLHPLDDLSYFGLWIHRFVKPSRAVALQGMVRRWSIPSQQ